MLMLIIVAFGAISFTRLSVDLFPKMELPMSVVVVNYPNAAPSEVESMVTRPVEQQLATVENLNSMTSYSMDNMSLVLAEFKNGTDMNFAGLDMREKIDLIADYLPDGATKPMVISMDPSMLPVAVMYVSSDRDMTELTRLMNDEVLPAIERTEGVASAQIFGGTSKEITVDVDQERLDGYGLTLAQISQLLAANNMSLPSGAVTSGSKEMVVRTVGDFKSIEDIKNVGLPLATREIVRLGDVADIKEIEKDADTIGRVNSKPAIGISITKQTVANTVQVSRQLEKAVEDIQDKHPDITITSSVDQSQFINESIRFVAESAILGCLFAVLICLLFLRRVISTLIIAISIPTSIIATFILMFATGLTMNMLSLSGLAVGIGMLVDDSIVVMENIFRRRANGLGPREAAIQGTKEVTMPVFAATMTKIAVFLPIVFVQGLAATIFKEFSFTIGFALICSLVVALTVIPMLCSRLLHIGQDDVDAFGYGDSNEGLPLPPGSGEMPAGRVPAKKPRFSPLLAFGHFIDRCIRGYSRSIKFSLHHRKTIVIICVVLLAVSSALIGIVGGELLPSSDEGQLSITAEVPYGTSLQKTDAIMTEIETYVKDNVDGLRDYSLSIGNTNMLSISSANTASITVNLVGKNDRDLSADEIAAQITDDLSGIAGAKIDVAVSDQMMMSMGGAPVSVSVSGDDLIELDRIAGEVAEIIKGVDGTKTVTSSLSEGNPEVRVTPDKAIASAYGITTYQLAQALRSSLSGTTATSYKVGGVDTDIVIKLNGEYADSIENMEQVTVLSPMGQPVRVGDIADISLANSPAQIEHQNQVRNVNITAELDGRDLSSVTSDIEAKLADYRLPDGYSYSIGGEAQEMQDSFTDLVYALLLAMLIIYMILASQFESLIQPFIIMLAVPFALTGAFLSMFITNTPLSLVAFIGIIMLAGIVVNNSILLVDFINQNKKRYATREEAIISAGKFRFRPIMMTMCTTCLGLLPLAIGFGSGGELVAPMGITVIGGLIFSTVVTLILIPVIYSVVDDVSERRRAKREARRAGKTVSVMS
jgi:HAE1 family hydrophobic/amphiphilic exporter-1